MLKRLLVAGLVLVLLVPVVGAGRRNAIRDSAWGTTVTTTLAAHVSGSPWNSLSLIIFGPGGYGGFVIFTTASGRTDTVRLAHDLGYTTDAEFDSAVIKRFASSDTVSFEYSME